MIEKAQTSRNCHHGGGNLTFDNRPRRASFPPCLPEAGWAHPWELGRG